MKFLPFAACFLLAAPLFAGDKPLPPGGVSLLKGDAVSAFKITSSASFMGSAAVVPVSGERFQRALQLRTLAKTTNSYEVQLYAESVAPIHAGDVMFARFYLRTLQSSAETGCGSTEMVIEQGPPDYKRLLAFGGSAGGRWQEFSIRFAASAGAMGGEAIPAGGAHIVFRLGYGPQTIEIGGVEVYDFGNRARIEQLPESSITYPGREADAPWRKAAEERIERIRKGDLAVLVTDSAGKPVPGATVSVNMLRHAFGFGSAVKEKMLLAQTPDGEKYRAVVRKYFNKVVIESGLKWPSWEKDPGDAMAAVKWLRDQGIAVRGHNLVWPTWEFMPKDVAALKGEALRKRIDDHITQEVTALKGQCCEWDVLNELYDKPEVTNILGTDEILSWYRLAHEADPAAKLFINDFDTVESGKSNNPHTDAYEQTIRFLLDHGAPLSGIGIQSHFGWNLPAPEGVLKGLDRFGKLGPGLEITEHDVDVADEQLQADYTRDYMTLAFSHPAVIGFLSWGFWEGAHWRPNGAYFRKDWSIKPAGQVWIDLVTKKWWTRASGVTDASGVYKTRGFFGDYEITVTRGGVSKTVRVSLAKGGPPVHVILE